jgi:ABC-2 type transport system ATP-binding protein
MSTQVLAALRGAHKRYGAIPALDGIDLEIREGELLSLLGVNGAGKTTALSLITGQIRADAGTVELFGGDPTLPAQRARLGVMLQEAELPEKLRVRELVHLQCQYFAAPMAVDGALALAGLGELAGRRYEQLSGGQKRRVQFALALAGNPRLLLIDEPTTGLDVGARRQFWQVVRDLKSRGVSIVLTTHYLEEADALADRIVVIGRGRVLADGSPMAIKARTHGRRIGAQSRLDLATVRGFAHVAQASESEGRITVRSAHVEDVLRQWLAADPGLTDLTVEALSLEDAFVELTAENGA